MLRQIPAKIIEQFVSREIHDDVDAAILFHDSESLYIFEVLRFFYDLRL